MRFSGQIIFFVFPNILVLAIPDRYIHFSDPGCPQLGTGDCNDVPYCQHHREQGDLFTNPSTYLESRNVPEPENPELNLTDITPRLLDVNSKRELIAQSVQCGTLSDANQREASDQFTSLSTKVTYDLIIDYPYNDATGETIGVFAQAALAPSYMRFKRLGQARTGFGGVRFTFQLIRNEIWHQVIFLGDKPATAAVSFYILVHK